MLQTMQTLTQTIVDVGYTSLNPRVDIATCALIVLASVIVFAHLLRSWRLDSPTRQITTWRVGIAAYYVLIIVGFSVSLLITTTTGSNALAYHPLIQVAVLIRIAIDAASAGKRTQDFGGCKREQ